MPKPLLQPLPPLFSEEAEAPGTSTIRVVA